MSDFDHLIGDPPRDAAALRHEFECALTEMQAAHDGLTAERTDTNFAAYGAACARARKAFDAWVQAGFDRARRERP